MMLKQKAVGDELISLVQQGQTRRTTLVLLASFLTPSLSWIMDRGPGSLVKRYSTKTAIQALAPTNLDSAYLSFPGQEGTFIFFTLDLSADLALDSLQGLHIPPNSDLSGASGAWVRQYEGDIKPKWFGAVGDNVTDDSAAIVGALVSGAVLISDNHLVESLVNRGAIRMTGCAEASIRSVTDDQSGLEISPQGVDNHAKHSKISSLKLGQSQSPNLSTGLFNDYAALKVKGSHGGEFHQLDLSDSDVAFSLQFGDANLGDRSNRNNNTSNFYATNLRGMGFECFGNHTGKHHGHHFAGDDGSGGRAIFHGLRMHAFDFAPNIANEFSIYTEKFLTGVSFQQYSNHNEVTVTAKDCEIGVHVHGRVEAVPANAICHNNVIRLNADGCDRAVGDGGGRSNRFIINAKNCGTPDAGGGCIRSVGGGFGGTDNEYLGLVKDGIGRLAWISSLRAVLDLRLIGLDTARASFGLLVDGSEATGSVVIRNAGFGALISGSGNHLSLDIKNCVTALSITNDDNLIYIDTDGDIFVSGDNCKVVGHVGGVVNDSGAGNDIKVLHS